MQYLSYSIADLINIENSEDSYLCVVAQFLCEFDVTVIVIEILKETFKTFPNVEWSRKKNVEVTIKISATNDRDHVEHLRVTKVGYLRWNEKYPKYLSNFGLKILEVSLYLTFNGLFLWWMYGQNQNKGLDVCFN